MKKEDIVGFRRRIAESNPSQLICVYYDMYFAFEEDILIGLAQNDMDAFLQGIRKCSEIATHLRSVLNFKYELSKELYPLYTRVIRNLARATYTFNKEDVAKASYIMGELQDAFREVAKADDRPAMIQNAQPVTAGLTYGKGELSEAVAADEQRRGFWA